MPKIPIITAQKLIKVLKKKGFVFDRIRGSHHIYIRQVDQISVSIPVHKGRDLGRGITFALLKDSDITPTEFLKLI